MKIKKYTAQTMKEALIKVKEDLGDSAMILKSQRLQRSLLPGKDGGVEVTAAVDEEAEASSAAHQPLSHGDTGAGPKLNTSYTSHLRHLSSQGEELRSSASRPPVYEKVAPSAKKESATQQQRDTSSSEEDTKGVQIIKLHDEISEMKTLLASILATGETRASGGYAGPWAILYKRLYDSGIREETARDLIASLKEISPNPGKEINHEFMKILAQSFPTMGKGGSGRMQVFVGPTGAGKTTTIAKLAAYYSLEKRKRVSLITSDTYRIAAVEQLRVYAEIVGVDLQVAYGAEDIPDLLENTRESEIVLVDTAGRSQKHREHLKELHTFLSCIQADTIHLVLSAGTKEEDLRDIIRRYTPFHIGHLVFTKLDETLTLGNVYNIVNEFLIPVSYLTFGQNVPDDIEFAQSGVFVKKLLERSSL
ncbi:flagellar biosynthesis protein FlhF [Chitinivibrio alkaliphilus]|uniref:Flagellar biosynthesis protein FlhF n=1 Tax=Chitinivibrio alkaliphilus ACht1 TaxID=1313304 RepID=U7DA52_9BACT|nr:flagellar biosynthesis protein FlhF [Chitinivibrio alkaliphilus]ERP38892.1 flagellar biosynthetic protein FlhF [Chitinivibrio alkaliphilus ACht1]